MKNKREDIVDDICGIKVADPYRWLEDGDAAEVKEWIADHNKQVDSALKGDNFSVFAQELAKNFKVVNFSNPIPVKGKYFYMERQPDEDQMVLYVKKGLDGEAVKLVDPNGRREGNTITIDYWSVSHSGRYVAYGLSEGGDEMSTLYVKDVESNQDIPEQIVHCRHSAVRWLPDDSGFFYTRNPRPGTVPKNEEHLHTKAYRHVLGTDPENDEMIFGAGRDKDDMVTLNLSQDGRYLGIHVSQNWSENDMHIYDVQTKETRPLIIGLHAHSSLRFLENKVLVHTDYKANNYRVLESSFDGMFKPIDDWKVLLPEGEHYMESFIITKDRMFAEYLVNACSEVRVFDHNGAELEKLPLPPFSSLAGLSCRRDEREFFYGVETFVFPKVLYRFNPDSSEYSEYRRTENPIDPDAYDVKQEWYASKDGTQIPMFIFHKKGISLDSKNPTVLYGYGGFNSSEVPMFMRNWVPWIERGGVFVVANIRGGGEFGNMWHKGGVKKNKQNTFDDFIAAGEHLISQKYTSTEYLGILGGSNGGLLTAAVSVQRPDLFQAACSRVPLTDMVRFPKFGIAMRWVHEYGDPQIKEDLENILRWSPYHNVKAGVKYPSFFFTTADKDTRVDSLHARKMTAALEDATSANKVLLSTEVDAGHGSGKPVIKIVESQALVLAFFANELGLKM